MFANFNTSLFLIGALIGFATAVVGAIVEYFVSLRRSSAEERRVPGCMLYVVGGLALTGIVALVASLVLTGGLRAALVMGLGVFVAFYLTFMLLFGLWLFIESRRPQPEAPDVTAAPSAGATSTPSSPQQ